MASVLHVTQPTDGAVARYVHDLAADQQARGFGVVVACPDRGSLAARLAVSGIVRRPWPATRAPRPQLLGEVLRLGRVVAATAPDVVHLHGSKAGLAGRLALHGSIPTLFQPHGWSWLAVGRATRAATLAWERYAARWTSITVCVGEGEARTGRDGGVGPSTVVETGIDLTRFRPADRGAARKRLGLNATSPLVVCVGRMSRRKGQDVLLAAWPVIRAEHPHATLALVGSGVGPSATGVLSPGPADDPRDWYAAADVVVLPSRWEGLPLTLLEAMAMSRCIIGSAIPGIADVLPPDAGALVPPADPAAIARAVSPRLGDARWADAEGRAGARYAIGRADIRRAHAELAELTARLARRSAARRPHSTSGYTSTTVGTIMGRRR
jgi:glycosyltransferase involved in cell wall biosynthesis